MMKAVKVFAPIWVSSMVTMCLLLLMYRSAEFATLAASKIFVFLLFCAFSFISTAIAFAAYKFMDKIVPDEDKPKRKE